MTNKTVPTFTGAQIKIWSTLTSLEEGETLIGEDLMLLVGYPPGPNGKRKLHKDIEVMRRELLPIGAYKTEGILGYYEMRTQEEVLEYYKRKMKEYTGMIRSLEGFTEGVLKDMEGEDFDFEAAKKKLAEKPEEELNDDDKRNDKENC